MSTAATDHSTFSETSIERVRGYWGLGRAPERRLDARTTLLEFAWSTLGPMVELKRVVLPAAR